MQDSLTIIRGLYQYIETNIHDAITLEMLEHHCRLSRFQINRLFLRTCGIPPVAYIRRRKLSHSMPELYGRRRLLDIALDYGFEHEQSYIRAFRAVYAASPAQYCKTHPNVLLTEPPLLNTLHVHADGFFINPEVQYRSPLVFQGVKEARNYREIDNGISLMEGLRNHKETHYIAACYPAGQGTFTQVYARNDATNNTRIMLPAGRYLVLEYTGLHTLDTLGARKVRTLMYMIIDGWCAANKYHWEHQFVERADMVLLREGYCEMQITVPLASMHL